MRNDVVNNARASLLLRKQRKTTHRLRLFCLLAWVVAIIAFTLFIREVTAADVISLVGR